MNRSTLPWLVILSLSAWASNFIAAQPVPRIQVVPHDVAPRVDILVRGKPFTSYVYLHSLLRPALDGVRSATGVAVTRDGLWFRHGDVNGIDFSGEGGGPARIVHRRVIEAISSDDEGQLGVEMAWMGPDEALTLVEDVRFEFREREHVRSIDRITRLSAVRRPVRLARTERGLVGVRLAERFIRGRAGVIGPEGPLDRAATGARGPWLAVSGRIGSQPITVALLDHPRNAGFPNTWRLDGSGSLEITSTANVDIAADRSITFRHRLVVFTGRVDLPAVNKEFHDFSAQGGTR